MDEYRRRHQARYHAEANAQEERPRQAPPPPAPRRAAGNEPRQPPRAAAAAAANGDQNLIDRAEDMLRQLGVFHLLTQRNIMMGAGIIFLAIILAQRLVIVVLLALLYAYLAQTMPTDVSFNEFFKTWFLEDVYPRASKQYRERKWNQRQNADPISSVIDSVKSWVHEKTEGLHGLAAYEAVRMQALPPRIERFPCWKVAYCTLDAPDQPDHQGPIAFIGIANRWFHNPLQTLMLE